MNTRKLSGAGLLVVLMCLVAGARAEGQGVEEGRSLDAAKARAAALAAESVDNADLSGLQRVAVVGLYGDEDGSIADYLTIKLIGTKLTVLAREDIEKVLDEYGFTINREDIFDPATLKRLGHILAADCILFGTVKEAGYEPEKGLATVRLNVKLANVETGALVWGEPVVATAQSQDWLAEQQKLEEERTREAARREAERERLEQEQAQRIEAARQQKLADEQRAKEQAEARETERRAELAKKWAGILVVAAVAIVLLVLILRMIKAGGKQVQVVAPAGTPSDEWAAISERLKKDSAVRAGIVARLRGAIVALRQAENAAHEAKTADAAQAIGQAVGDVTSLAADIENAPAGDKFAVDKSKVAGGTLDKIIAFDTVFEELVTSISTEAGAIDAAVSSEGNVDAKVRQLKALVSQLRAKYDERDAYVRELI